MLRIAICDDQCEITSKIENLVYKYGRPNVRDCSVFFNGYELYNNMANGNSFDLIYLDIEMEGMNGIDTAKKIRNIDKNVKIIFVTFHKNYSMDGYEVNAFRFMKKPIDEVKFKEYFYSALDDILISDKYFIYSFNKITYKINTKDIMYFDNYKKVTYIHTNNGVEKCYIKITDIEKDFENRKIIFLRTSLTTLVNPKYVYTYRSRYIILKNDKEISISNDRKTKVMELIVSMKRGDFTE